MKQAIIYGVGTQGKQVAPYILPDYDILDFVDNDTSTQKSLMELKPYPLFAPQSLHNLHFSQSKINTSIHAKSAFSNSLAQILKNQTFCFQNHCEPTSGHFGGL